MTRPRLTDKRMECLRTLARAMEFELENRWLEQFTKDYAKELEETMRVGINYIAKLQAWKHYQKERS